MWNEYVKISFTNSYILMHILFDADWTFLATDLLNAEELWVDNTVLQSFFVEAFPPTVTWKANLKEVLPPYLTKMGWDKWVEAFLKAWFESQNTIREGMLELVQMLQSQWHTCSLCTQQEQYRCNYMREAMKLSEVFDHLYFTAELWYSKKDPNFFSAILESSTFSHEDTFFIDDKLSYWETANAVWIQSFYFTDNINELKRRLDTLLDIPKLWG